MNGKILKSLAYICGVAFVFALFSCSFVEETFGPYNFQSGDSVSGGNGSSGGSITILSNVYVSPLGNDANSGTSNSPVRTIQKALDMANYPGQKTIYSEQGNYHEMIIITNSSVILSGGWDATFASNAGHSFVSGYSLPGPIINITNVSNITVDGFVLLGITNGTVLGGGMALFNTTNCLITNLVFSNNAAFMGGACYISKCSNLEFSAFVRNNSASNGGGIYLGDSSTVDISGNISTTNNASRGGGLYLDRNTNVNIYSIISNNGAASDGGISLDAISLNINVIGPVGGNVVGNTGVH